MPPAAVAVETGLSLPQGAEAEDDAASMVVGEETIGILDMLDNEAEEDRWDNLVAVGVDAKNLDVEELKMLKDNLVVAVVAAASLDADELEMLVDDLVVAVVAAVSLDADELKMLVHDPSAAYFVVQEVVSLQVAMA